MVVIYVRIDFKFKWKLIMNNLIVCKEYICCYCFEYNNEVKNKLSIKEINGFDLVRDF